MLIKLIISGFIILIALAVMIVLSIFKRRKCRKLKKSQTLAFSLFKVFKKRTVSDYDYKFYDKLNYEDVFTLPEELTINEFYLNKEKMIKNRIVFKEIADAIKGNKISKEDNLIAVLTLVSKQLSDMKGKLR